VTNLQENPLPRKYELKRRAENVEETRRRIVEAAVELHGTLGPARTTVSAIAERAGVQRQTYYRHFPEERELFAACSGLWQETHQPPDPEGLREIADGVERLRAALTGLYAFYEGGEEMIANVARDAAVHQLTAETARWRMEAMGHLRDILAEVVVPAGEAPRAEALLELALDFATWRALVRRSGLSRDDAVELFVELLGCVGSTSP
jgi:AcrR family transcriptional regulator